MPKFVIRSVDIAGGGTGMELATVWVEGEEIVRVDGTSFQADIIRQAMADGEPASRVIGSYANAMGTELERVSA